MKTSLIGECLNKLELPSNSNIINSLKKANEDYGKYNENLLKKLVLTEKTVTVTVDVTVYSDPISGKLLSVLQTGRKWFSIGLYEHTR